MKKILYLILWFSMYSNLFGQYSKITEINSPSGIAIKDYNLYFVQLSNSIIGKIDLNNPNHLIDTLYFNNDQGRYYDIEIVDSILFISVPLENKIFKFNLKTPNLPPTELIKFSQENELPYDLEVNENFLYFTLPGLNGNNNGKICRLDYSTSNPSFQILISNINGPTDISLHNNHLYYFSSSDGSIKQVSLTDLSEEKIISDLNDVLTFYVDENGIYVIEENKNKILVFNDSDYSLVNEISIIPLDQIVELIREGNTLYFSDLSNNQISKFELNTTFIKKLSNSNTYLKLYPNPVINSIKLLDNYTYNSYSIINSNGQTALYGKIGSENKINVQNLESGRYILLINGTQSIGFVKK